MVKLSLVILWLALGSAHGQFKNQAAAQAAFDSMYGGGQLEAESSFEGLEQDEYNSIREFVSYVAKHNQDTVFIVYGAPAHLEAAALLRSFLARLRNFPLEMADSDLTGILIVDQKSVDPNQANRSKFFVLGSPSDNKFIHSMEKSGKLSTSKTKAQFRLFRTPNCLAIACRDNKMFLEMVRVLVRSHDDFEEAVYSYFYLK